ncbi:hypothetical protein AB0A61_38625, partial [Streptomyces sp. NPDC046197]
FQMTGHTGPVHSVACTVLDDTPTAITASHDQTIRAWDLHTGEPTDLLKLHGPLAVAVSSEGDLVVGSDHHVAVFRRGSTHGTTSLPAGVTYPTFEAGD